MDVVICPLPLAIYHEAEELGPGPRYYVDRRCTMVTTNASIPARISEVKVEAPGVQHI